MSHNIEDKETTPSSSGENIRPEGVSDKRRHLIKGIGATAPLMMTIASRPVLGAQCTPSAWVSGNLSDHGQTRMSCGGRSPGYWKTRGGRWAVTGFVPGTCKHSAMTHVCRGYKSDGTAFHQSAGGIFAGRVFGHKTMMQVLWLNGNEDPYQLGAHIVAALLNAASIPDYGMDRNDVAEMYRQLVTAGLYQPSVGEAMTAQDCVRFIQNTFE